MGCQLGKLAASERRGPSEPLNDVPPPPAPDPRLPLTAKQKYSMLASWKGISRAMEKTGICMFVKLFEENKDLLDMFEKFRQCRTREEQISSMELAEHANNVMSTLDEGIKGLDDLDNFFQYIHQVGASHRRIPGFKVEYFWKIEAPFLAAVESTLGDRYTPNVENIYKITIKFILQTLIDGYEKAGKTT
ncbi:neuroglobin-like [Aricia agestis]|uniref:neuroglobin-like n=1 Tax=Aricia agestis TaxID=91739 RepID=UPI001C20560C|nr:neuroglobin-like [Aricia agestis]XP_041981234.1 neuroglobin-like [Aricia agestis]